jgi:hypothetical protein
MKLVARVGVAPVLTAGLLGLGGVLSTSLLWTADMPYWQLGTWFFGLAAAMSWVMGPATASVMGTVPEEKSGVASAMNDVTRQVGGALGSAVVGSLITSLYASRLGDATDALPEAARVASEDSIGQTNAVAAGLPAADGAQLAHSASSAFTEAIAIGFTVAGAVAIAAALVVRRYLPFDRPAHNVPVPAAA